MEITSSAVSHRAHFLQQFENWAVEHHQLVAESDFAVFIRVYLQRFPLDEWVGRYFNDLYGLCFGLFHMLEKQPTQQAQVSVFNPNLDEHGWQCGRTVVYILQQDMPFLVDSIRIALNRKDIPIYMVKSTVLDVVREEPKITVSSSLNRNDTPSTASREALMYFEVSLQPDDKELVQLKKALSSTLTDVASVVNDHALVLSHLQEAHDNIAQHRPEETEVLEFAQWLRHRHFAFLGYRAYRFIDVNGSQALEEDAQSRCGIFKRVTIETTVIHKADFSEGMQQFYEGEEVVCFSKAATHSTVHRAVYPDYVVFKQFDAQGVVCGEVRFLGLFTYEVLTQTPFSIPILRQKTDAIIERAGLDLSSHDGKNLVRTIESYPRAELIQTDIYTLYHNIMSIVDINERHLVRLIIRHDPFGNFVTCNVFVPKDTYHSVIRQKIQDILSHVFESEFFDFNTYFSESNLVRAQFIFRVEQGKTFDYDADELEEQIASVTRNWDDELRVALIEKLGESNGIIAHNNYKQGFSQGYQETFDARYAVKDIELLETLSESGQIAMNFYQPIGYESRLMRFRILHLGKALILSDVIPILENLGLRVLGENPYRINRKDGVCVWIHDFELCLGLDIALDTHAVKNLFELAFAAIWRGEAESDAFNKLVLGARLNWREVSLLRAYAGYMKQTGFSADQNFIADTLAHYTEIARNLVAVFKSHFDPRLHRDSKNVDRAERLAAKTVAALDQVSNLNEDRVIRRYLELLDGTLRTNFYQQQGGLPKPYVSFKFSPRTIPDIPEPRPLYEIYVYSPRVEGVHLRGGKVARGGLRWSDRNQDYRTEVLGLVKAQQVKNAVIVPNGAKGGFVAKQLPTDGGRDAFMKEGIECYKLFIRGLLDLTDNFVENKIVPPENTLRRDEDDPYLVVAADKGTATFSDIANAISLEYKHWLGDAFASGGSQGYDHKGMGITAKGAWVSVQRHFREVGVDIQKKDFSVIGIGDMAGDVFGNGMLLSKHICLKAAFNHLHIFIDPTPNSAKSYKERLRMFNLPRSSWEDYDSSLISEGGGVFLRSAKSIAITPQMKKAFDLQADRMTPNELVTALLKAPVDLIWNGGIGTYVKSSEETHSDVGDKANDSLRVNGAQLRCKVFGEGGNLGMTQLGRIEFCLAGGACNTDFIDNAAGVDCSDHEVNIKILLDEQVANGDLTSKQRNELLASMTDEVADLVLQNNYRQTQAISVAQFQSAGRANEYRQFIDFLESTGHLNRALEFLPSDEQILDRLSKGKSLTRPELSVLISYAKVMLKEELIQSDIAEDEYIARAIETAVPKTLVKKYRKALYQHRLRREIVGTQIANDLINSLGITGGQRLMETTGAEFKDIARSYVVSRDVFEFDEFQQFLKSMDHKVPAQLQADLMANMIRRVRRGTRWFLRNRKADADMGIYVNEFRIGLETVYEVTAKAVEGRSREEWRTRSRLYEELEVPEHWALRLAMPDNLFSGLGIIESAHTLNADVEPAGKQSAVKPVTVEQVTEVYFHLLDFLELGWFASQVSEVNVENYWQALARESNLDELESHIRRLTISLVNLRGEKQSAEDFSAGVVAAWASDNKSLINRWTQVVHQIQGSAATDYAMFSVALRELLDLVVATEHYAHTHRKDDQQQNGQENSSDEVRVDFTQSRRAGDANGS